MKSFILVLGLTFVFSEPVLVQDRVAPDYMNAEKWNERRQDQSVKYDLKGEEVNLLLKHYSFHTNPEVGEHAVILHDVEGKPWILMHIVENEHSSGDYLFNQKEGKWEFVQQILHENDILGILKTKYGLTPK